jgi:anti-anti-sigma factor
VSGNDGIVWYLRIQEEHLGTVVVLRLEGRVYSATSGDLAAAIARFCTAERRALVLDLSAVDYINGEGVRLIESATDRHRAMQSDVIVCGLSPIVRTAFDLAGATARLSIEPSREAALARVQRP